MSRFKIGQKVVCVKSHSQKVVIKNKTYPVTEYGCCKNIYVGVTMDISIYNNEQCFCCNTKIELSNKWWVSEDLFAPLQEDGSTKALVECIEELKLEELELS